MVSAPRIPQESVWPIGKGLLQPRILAYWSKKANPTFFQNHALLRDQLPDGNFIGGMDKIRRLMLGNP